MAGEDNAVITLRAASGAAVTLLGNLASSGCPASQADEMLVLGDAGTIQLHGDRPE